MFSCDSENLEHNLNTEKREYSSRKIIDNVNVMNKMIEEILQFSKSEEIKKGLSDAGIPVEEKTFYVKSKPGDAQLNEAAAFARSFL